MSDFPSAPPTSCSICGSEDSMSCAHGARGGDGYYLGPPEFFGRIVGKCPACNSLIGSSKGVCDSPWCQAKKSGKIPVPICPSCGREAANDHPGYLDQFFQCGHCVAGGRPLFFWGTIHALAAPNVKKRAPWWSRDQDGWPIERIMNLPAWRYWLRVVAQNIRKVTG